MNESLLERFSQLMGGMTIYELLQKRTVRAGGLLFAAGVGILNSASVPIVDLFKTN